MSALSHRSHMLEFFKNIFQRRPLKDDIAEETFPQRNISGAASPSPAPPTPTAADSRTRSASPRPGNGNSIEVSLQAVFTAFPPELKSRIRQTDVGEATVSVPLDKVLSQLPHGAVKITYGELRRAAPQLFSGGGDSDQAPVKLPLNEILLQVDPARLARRPNQKHIEVPEEIRSPFGDRGNGLIFSVGPANAPAAAPVRPVSSATPAPTAPAPAKPLPPSPFSPLKPAPPHAAPAQPIAFRGSIGSPPTPPTTVARPAGPPPASTLPPAFRGVGAAAPPGSAKESTLPRPPGLTREPVSPPKKPAIEGPTLTVQLMNLAENWPEALRHEIAQLNLADAKVALPGQIVEQALKRGRVTFPWKVLRSWIRPAPLPAVSVHDNAVLELPLKVIAPLFLNRRQEAGKSRQKVAIDESIPNLFFGFPQPGAPAPIEAPPAGTHSHAATKPVDTNYYVWEDTSDSARVDETEFKRKQEPSPGTNFLTRYATPNEVVSRAAALDEVAGALIALPDGLMVASRLSPDLNGETLAAFLPQIFGKVSQCTKELRMGELNNLNFTVGNVPWKIFRVNAIFFAAFGRPGQPLPTGQLAALAAELDRKKQ